MSRGPGRIEQAIRVAFSENRNSTFTVDDLAGIAYPGLNRIEKKHRVSILRAAGAASAALGWWYQCSEQPGHAVIYYNPLDVRSYATGRLRCDFLHAQEPLAAIEKLLDDPDCHGSYWRHIQPGGPWWKHVEINQAHTAGDDTRATQMRDELNASVRAQMQALTPRRRGE